MDAVAAIPALNASVAGGLLSATLPPPLDETAETVPDTAITAADNLAKRTDLILMEEQVHAQNREMRLDRLRMSFDCAQKEHAELLREMNALRDMATEQMKQDDANLKKWIALI